ncbi:MAG: hypothetical protein MI919_19245, partial [Holophagales bacterium]|nr:hypothetical protein [Holophagales bacterium]
TTETFTYYPLAQLATRTLTDSSGNPLLDDTWTWNPLDSLTHHTEGVGGRDQSFAYTATDACKLGTGNTRRLVSYQGESTYCYDTAGNRTQAGATSYAYYPETHRVEKATSGSPFAATYDADGNMSTAVDSAGTDWSYTLDPLHRLIQATAGDPNRGSSGEGPTTVFVYDVHGRRLQKTAAAGTVTVYVSPRYVLEGSTTTKYVDAHGGKRGALVSEPGSDPAPGYFFLDQLDSVVLATDPSGQPLARVAYDPWGAIDAGNSSNADSLRYTYQGKELDGDTGLYHFEARYYEPSIGRFLRADTRLGGALDRQDAPNRYALVLNDPVSLADPTGHSWYSHAWHATKKAARRAARLDLKILEAPYQEADRIVHSTTGKVVLSAVIDGAEIGAGLALMAATFGGSSTLSSTLIGAGVAGAEYTLSHRGSNFSWKGYGEAEAVGAVSGLVSGGLGELGGAAIDSAALGDSSTIIAKSVLGSVTKPLGTAAGQATHNLLTGHPVGRGIDWKGLGESAAIGFGKGGLKATYKAYTKPGAEDEETAGSEIEMTEME